MEWNSEDFKNKICTYYARQSVLYLQRQQSRNLAKEPSESLKVFSLKSNHIYALWKSKWFSNKIYHKHVMPSTNM